MIQKIKSHMVSVVAVFMLAVPALVPVAVSASGTCASNITSSVSQGASDAASSGGSSSTVDCSTPGNGSDTIATIASKIVNIFSIIVGAVAVIMIIYSGFRYITSGGDSGRVGSAKNSLIYAILGLVVVAIAQLIVHFVLNQSSSLGT